MNRVEKLAAARWYAENTPLIGRAIEAYAEASIQSARLLTKRGESISVPAEAMTAMGGLSWELLTYGIAYFYPNATTLVDNARGSRHWCKNSMGLIDPRWCMEANGQVLMHPCDEMKTIILARSPSELYEQIPKAWEEHILAGLPVPLYGARVFKIEGSMALKLASLYDANSLQPTAYQDEKGKWQITFSRRRPQPAGTPVPPNEAKNWMNTMGLAAYDCATYVRKELAKWADEFIPRETGTLYWKDPFPMPELL